MSPTESPNSYLWARFALPTLQILLQLHPMNISRLRAVTRQVYYRLRYLLLRYCACRWNELGTMLGNTTARVIYTLPVAGYVILYSDYFQEKLFRFSHMEGNSW